MSEPGSDRDSTDERRPSAYRYVIELLFILAVLAQNLSWLAPAPVLAPIIRELGISLGQAGLIISVIALCIAIFSTLGAILAERIGALSTMIIGIWLLAISEILSGYTHSFGTLLLCRVLEGVGFGLMIAPPATLLMQWFPRREWPYVLMVNGLCLYGGLTLAFRVTVPIYLAVGSSWHSVFTYYGMVVAVVALLWTALGRNRDSESRPVISIGREASAIPAVLRDRHIVNFAIGFFGGMSIIQLYTAFLPQYFASNRGLSLAEASALTALVPTTAVFAAVGGGMGTAWLKLRKPFTWPISLLTLCGCVGSLMFSRIEMIKLSLIMMGMGMGGLFAPASTLLMELPGMTSKKMGAAQALSFSFAYVGAFISPFVGGALAESFGLKKVMFSFLIMQMMSAICLFRLPETGPGRSSTKATTHPAAESL